MFITLSLWIRSFLILKPVTVGLIGINILCKTNLNITTVIFKLFQVLSAFKHIHTDELFSFVNINYEHFLTGGI